MFCFFNQKSTTQAVMQGINAVAFAYAAVRIVIDPQQSFRFGLDLAVHGLTVLAMQGNDNLLTRLAASGANFVRLGAIYADATGTGPFGVAEAVDTVLHGANTLTTSFGGL